MTYQFSVKGILTLSIVVGSFSLSPCSKGTWECRKIQECIEGPRVCDGSPDCKDSTDELLCRDRFQDVIWNNMYKKRPEADRETLEATCDFVDMPEKCLCKQKTRMYCLNAGLASFPTNIPVKATVLDISNNKIDFIPPGFFGNFSLLAELSLMHNLVSTLGANVFDGCVKLKKLFLGDNAIYSIHPDFLPKDNSLEELHIEHNLLKSLDGAAFRRLSHLKILFLQHNRIADILPGTFTSIRNISLLFLTGNQLSIVRRDMFSDLGNLLHLHLGENKLSEIEDYAFSPLLNVRSLSLSSNNIRRLRRHTFIGLGNVTFLDLRHNSIAAIDIHSFQPLGRLKSLDLRENAVRSFPSQTISILSELENIYFDEFYMCAYAPYVPNCEPFGDGISSKHNLLENVFLRVMVWIVAMISCLGNLVVIMGRFLLRDDNQIHSFYIKNLSVADFLMGIYLIIIGSRDQMYRGNYLQHDLSWRQSSECDICGILCTLSSEISVLTLTLITLDRFICIVFPLYSRRKSFKTACVVMCCVWTSSILVTIIPVLGFSYFGKSFYRDNSVCIPLHLHNPKVKGWEYSTFLFLGINCLAFAFICFAYSAMFISIRKTTKAVRSHFQNQERRLANRFFFIVMTDFLCWAPIMVMKVAALTGMHIDGNLYAWLVVFILPVNSAINPLLYTLTTKLFKEKVLPRFCCGYTITRRQYVIQEASSSSMSSDRRKRSTSMRNKYEKDLYEAGIHTLKYGSLMYNSKNRSKQSDRLQFEDRIKASSKPYLCFKTRDSFRRSPNTGAIVDDQRNVISSAPFLRISSSSSF